MATAFPTALDSFVNPTASSNMSDLPVLHHVQHSNLNDAVRAMQVYIGTAGSVATTDLTGKLANAGVGATVQIGALVASPTAAPNATAVQSALGGYAVSGHGHSITAISGAQASLVSGTNIKTVNGQSLLGTGDLTVASGTTSISTAFSQAVLLDDNRTMGTYTQASALAFTPSGAAVSNASNRVTIIPDGVSAITFPGFTQATGGDVFAAGFRMTAIFYAIDALSPKYLWDKGAAVVAATAPGQVTGLTLGAATSTTQPLTWTAPASNGGSALTDYLIEYKLAAAGAYTTFVHTASTTTAIVVTGLPSASSHNFRVSAVNSIGPGTPSAVGTGSTAAAGAGSIAVSAPLTQTTDDLTALGYLDYLAFAGPSTGGVDNRKAGANLITGPTFTNMTRATGGSASPTYSWTDGSPTTLGSTSVTGAWSLTSTAADGLIDFVVPAGVGVKRARIYVGIYCDGARNSTTSLSFTLSDGSFAPQTVTPPKTSGSFVTSNYEVVYNANAAAQTLQIRFKEASAGVVGIGSGMCIRVVTYGN